MPLRKLLPIILLAAFTTPALAVNYDLLIHNATLYDGSGNPPTTAPSPSTATPSPPSAISPTPPAPSPSTPKATPSRPASSTCSVGPPTHSSKTAAPSATSSRASPSKSSAKASPWAPVSEEMKQLLEHAKAITNTRSSGTPSASTSHTSNAKASPATSPHSSAPPPSASTHSATKTARPTPPSSTKCAPSSAPPWKKARSASAPPSSIPPPFYASTEELIELCKVAAEYDGMYISHMRSEGNQLLEAIDELLRIAREAGIRAEIYHLKAAGQANWPKMDHAISKIARARGDGLDITADMYTYVAGATGLDAMFPPGSPKAAATNSKSVSAIPKPKPASSPKCAKIPTPGKTSAKWSAPPTTSSSPDS